MSERATTRTAQQQQTPTSSASGVLQRKCDCGNHTIAGGECEECSRKQAPLQRFAANDNDVVGAPPIVHDVLNSPGQPLDAATRIFMERRFSHDFSAIRSIGKPEGIPRSGITVRPHNDRFEHQAETAAEKIANQNNTPLEYQQAERTGPDFSQVRIHAGPKAAESARAIGARAYTVSNSIVFGEGAYSPNSSTGRRLVAHELTHVIQQQTLPASGQIQRACDPATFAVRTQPVFFPSQTSISQVYAGTTTIRNGSTRFAAVGLIQQALVDLGFSLGTTGPNHDGVDRIFGPLTEQAVTAFQTTETIPGVTAGVVDQGTLKCLDEVRSHRTVAANLTGVVPEEQFQVLGEETGGRDEDIFFERGSTTLDAEDVDKIHRLSVANKGCALTLNGFISEDERIDFGDQLATDRLNVVDAAFNAENHQDAGVCTPPVPPPPPPPLRTLVPRPADSEGVLPYQDRRRVEVVTITGPSRTPACARGAIRQRPLDTTEAPMFATALTDGLAMIDSAKSQLVVGNAAGDAALTSFFGSTSPRNTVKSKLTTWRNHINTVVRARNQRGTGCDSGCSNAIAYNNGVGGSAMMTLCGDFFGIGTMSQLYPTMTDAERRAVVLVHEAGHGSLDLQDLAYDNVRLIHFIQNTPSLALKNTDSFVFLIRCLAGLPDSCAPDVRGDTPSANMSAAQLELAQEGIAWLSSWMIWAGQDAGGAYGTINESRTGGSWTNPYYQGIFDLITSAFHLRRPGFAPLPTMREQTTVAAIWDRLRLMEQGAEADLTINRDASATPVLRWVTGTRGPSDEVFLTDFYFAIVSPRGRVNLLLPIIVEATPAIDTSLRPSYIRFIQDTVRLNWGNHP
ncbi:MAG: DUF4157 domain-containing protein [Acidobacteriota bacterium]